MSIIIEDEEIICDCGNSPSGSGWNTCDKEGYDQEPSINSNWNMTYRCNDCGIVYDQNNDVIIKYFTDWDNVLICVY